MITLYIVSTESFSGKTALCYGIATRLKRDGMRVGYFKPLVFFGKRVEGRTISEDAPFMRAALGLKESDDTLAPVVLDALAIEHAAAGKPNDYVARIDRAFALASRDKDVVVVEGAANLAEGTLLGLLPQQMADRLNASVLAVAKYNHDLVGDGLLAAQVQFGKRFVGAVVNEVPPPRMEFAAHSIVPHLEARGIHVYATLPQERLLLSITVNEIADALDGEILNSPERGEELVENIMVGAMSVDSALSYFRRKPNKAVITGGDRADILLAALETSTRCLVLTGNLRPSPIILGRAEELGVPLILAKQDTLSAVEIIQQYFGKLRLHQPRKVERFEQLLNERFDFARLYKDLGVGH
ncbi:MAG: phosphotransacetylase family protein [Chloroflexota bacterium]|nr:phosphotransacetylase family protein [Chloroflexota bacterium]